MQRAPTVVLVLVGLLASACGELSLSSVSPDLIRVGEEAELEVRGAGFDEALRLRLVGPGVEVSLAPLTLEGDGVARARVPAAAPVGTYSLVASSGGLEARLADALRVSASGLRVSFLNVGQGDATLVVAPSGEALLIDGGPRGADQAVRDAIAREAQGRLDAVVLSHFDADHLAGLVEVLAGDDEVPGNGDDLVPELVLGPADDGACETQTCGRLRSLQAWPFEEARVGRRFSLGEAEVEIVAADGDVGAGPVAGADANERSVVVLVRYAGRTVLVTGDLTGGGNGTLDLETPLAEQTGPVDVLRVAHHGSRTSGAASALDRWQPLASVFSFGTDNAYCHPEQAVLDRVAARSGAVYATGLGVVQSVDRCDAATEAPAGARLGLGDVVLGIDELGEITLAGDAL